MAKNLTNISNTFAWKFVFEAFQKSPDLVTLTTTLVVLLKSFEFECGKVDLKYWAKYHSFLPKNFHSFWICQLPTNNITISNNLLEFEQIWNFFRLAFPTFLKLKVADN